MSERQPAHAPFKKLADAGVLAVWTLVIVALTFAVHEVAHGLASAWLGYDTFVRVNSSGLVAGSYRSQFDEDLTTALGPVVTVLQGALGLWLVHRRAWRPAVLVVLAALLMRVLAAVASLRLPNDEARLGLSWGLGYWTVHAIVILALLAMAVWSLRSLRPRPWTVVTMLLGVCASMVAVVALEPSLPTWTISARR